MKRIINGSYIKFLTVVFFTALSVKGVSQQYEIAIHSTPVISWMKSNESVYTGEGLKPGVDIGIDLYRFFGNNFAVYAGAGFLSTGGRQSMTVDHTMEFDNFSLYIPAGTEVKYNLKYLNIPAGLHFRTNRIGSLTYYADLGVDLRIMLKSTADILALDIQKENAGNEVYGMNTGWHIGGGLEYELNPKASIITGLSYGQDFFDITKDLENAFQPDDRSRLKMICITLGINFLTRMP